MSEEASSSAVASSAPVASAQDNLNPGAEEKIAVAREKKDEGDQAFKKGELQNALRAYHTAILYLSGIYKNAAAAALPGGPSENAEDKPKTEADEILAKIYANMAACHIKQGNWKRVIETCDKALAKDKENTKALFRKAKAQGELGYFEKAEKALLELHEKAPDSEKATIDAELARLRAADKEREKLHNQKFRGFLNRDKGKEPARG